MNSLNEINLSHFTGTEKYYSYRIGRNEILLTDGCKYVADKGQAYWLFDIILFYQNHNNIKGEYFQVWSLKKNSEASWSITCDDGNDNILITQHIEYSDFPLSFISFYVVDKVCMLKSEY